ncbi:Z-ring associated protein ZapG [Vibrio sp. RC27]
MPWMYAIVGLLVGCVVGAIVSRITAPQYKNQKSIQKELDASKFALEQQRQELMDHFSQTAGMLDTIGKDYTKLYQHLAKSSSELIPNIPEQDNPFIKTIEKKNKVTTETEVNDSTSTETQPKDYAKGSSGLLKPEDKPSVTEKDS